MKRAFNAMAYGFKIIPEKTIGASMKLLEKMKDAGFVALNSVYDSVTPKQPALARISSLPKPSGMK